MSVASHARDGSEPGDLQIVLVRAATGGLVLRGELDLDTAPRLMDAVRACPPTVPLTIDASELSFADSTGILTLAHLGAGRQPPGVTLLQPTRTVRRLLEVMGIDHDRNAAFIDGTYAPEAMGGGGLGGTGVGGGGG